MNIKLIRATIEDSQELWQMQLESFQPLLEKYQDYDTNPASEPIDKMLVRLNQEEGNCYLYEKMGYHRTGKTKAINDKLTLVFYEK